MNLSPCCACLCVFAVLRGRADASWQTWLVGLTLTVWLQLWYVHTVQGTLVFIAASDILPSLLENEKKHSPGVVLRHLLLMAVGVIALGLTKLHHKHCDAGGHAHAAHDH